LAAGWHEIEAGNKTMVAYEPPDSVPMRGCVVFLHDVDGLTPAASPVFASLFNKHGLACLCPKADGTWWLDRTWPAFDDKTTAERWVVQELVPFAKSRWRLHSGGIGLLGLGMGGQGSLRLGFRYPQAFPTVVGLNSMLDFHELYHEGTALDEMYESKERCRQDTAVLQIHPAEYPAHILFACDPANQRWLRGNDRLHEKLSALGIAHEVDFATSAGGDSWGYAELTAERAVEFFVRGMAHESRRLM
jgi:S-formylglutathione hydrolase